MWRDGTGSTARTAIDKIRGRGQCFGQERRRNVRVKEHGADAVVQGAQRALSFAVLRGGVRAGETEANAVLLEIAAHGEVVEFPAIVGLESQDRQTELASNVRTERHKRWNYIGFLQ